MKLEVKIDKYINEASSDTIPGFSQDGDFDKTFKEVIDTMSKYIIKALENKEFEPNNNVGTWKGRKESYWKNREDWFSFWQPSAKGIHLLVAIHALKDEDPMKFGSVVGVYTASNKKNIVSLDKKGFFFKKNITSLSKIQGKIENHLDIILEKLPKEGYILSKKGYGKPLNDDGYYEIEKGDVEKIHPEHQDYLKIKE